MSFLSNQVLSEIVFLQLQVRELKSQIEDLVANLGAQKEKLSQQKLEHETEVLNLEWILDMVVGYLSFDMYDLHHFCQLDQLFW